MRTKSGSDEEWSYPLMRNLKKKSHRIGDSKRRCKFPKLKDIAEPELKLRLQAQSRPAKPAEAPVKKGKPAPLNIPASASTKLPEPEKPKPEEPKEPPMVFYGESFTLAEPKAKKPEPKKGISGKKTRKLASKPSEDEVPCEEIGKPAAKKDPKIAFKEPEKAAVKPATKPGEAASKDPKTALTTKPGDLKKPEVTGTTKPVAKPASKAPSKPSFDEEIPCEDLGGPAPTKKTPTINFKEPVKPVGKAAEPVKPVAKPAEAAKPGTKPAEPAKPVAKPGEVAKPGSKTIPKLKLPGDEPEAAATLSLPKKPAATSKKPVDGEIPADLLSEAPKKPAVTPKFKPPGEELKSATVETYAKPVPKLKTEPEADATLPLPKKPAAAKPITPVKPGDKEVPAEPLGVAPAKKATPLPKFKDPSEESKPVAAKPVAKPGDQEVPAEPLGGPLKKMTPAPKFKDPSEEPKPLAAKPAVSAAKPVAKPATPAKPGDKEVPAETLGGSSKESGTYAEIQGSK
ncbi:unnamed protein product, partial [Mesorhabditis spiculigera]